MSATTGTIFTASTIFTAGYARLRDPERLAALAAAHDAVIIDVRLRPYTRFKGWSRGAFQAKFGTRYRRVEAFGNANYRGGPVRLQATADGLAEVTPLLAQGSVILLCGCADPAACHRSTVAALLAEATGCPIMHLDPPPAASEPEPGPIQPRLL